MHPTSLPPPPGFQYYNVENNRIQCGRQIGKKVLAIPGSLDVIS